MSAIPFHYIDLRTFSYETEDERRVERALREFLPTDVTLERSETTGHYGDRIVVLSTRIERADEMRMVLDRIRASPDIDRIREELSERIDEECALFIRFDKQSAYEDAIHLGDGIELRAKVEAYPAKRESAIKNAREAI